MSGKIQGNSTPGKQLDEVESAKMLHELFRSVDSLKSGHVRSTQLVAAIFQLSSSSEQQLEDLQHLLDPNDSDVLVTADRFVKVGLEWIAKMSEVEDANGGGKSFTDSFSLNATYGSLNGTGTLGDSERFYDDDDDKSLQIKQLRLKNQDLEKELSRLGDEFEENLISAENNQKVLKIKVSEKDKLIDQLQKKLSEEVTQRKKLEDDITDIQMHSSEEKGHLMKQLEVAKERFTLKCDDGPPNDEAERLKSENDSLRQEVEILRAKSFTKLPESTINLKNESKVLYCNLCTITLSTKNLLRFPEQIASRYKKVQRV